MATDDTWQDDGELSPWDTLLRRFGPEAAANFRHKFRGQKVVIPYTITPDSPLAEVIGREHAAAVAEECGGCDFYVRKDDRRHEQVLELVHMGVRKADIAKRVNLTERHVYGIRRTHRLKAERAALSAQSTQTKDL